MISTTNKVSGLQNI